MSQQYRQKFQPEINYNDHIRFALQTVIELPKVSDFASEQNAMGVRSASRFSPERHARAVQNVALMIVKRMRNPEYQNVLDSSKDPDKVWEAIWELLDTNGFWIATRGRKATLSR